MKMAIKDEDYVLAMTASLRFESELNLDLNELQTNLVPFHRRHFMLRAMAPITTQKKETNNLFAKIADYDAKEDKHMAVFVNHRGQVKAKRRRRRCSG